MARANTRPSEVASSRYASATPGLSDQENRDPHGMSRRTSKGNGKEMSSRGSLPTPTSANGSEGRPQKRKRTGDAQDEIDEVEERFTRYFDPNQDPDKLSLIHI